MLDQGGASVGLGEADVSDCSGAAPTYVSTHSNQRVHMRWHICMCIYVDIYGTHVSHVSTLIQIKGYEMAQSAISTMSEVMCTCTLSHTYNILHCSKHGVVSDKADTKSLQRRYPTLFGRD